MASANAGSVAPVVLNASACFVLFQLLHLAIRC